MTDTTEAPDGQAPMRAVRFKAWTRLAHFAQYHGIWALGVRLMRSQSIRRQALIVFLICVSPVAIVFNSAIGDAKAKLSADAAAIDGLSHLEVVAALIGTASELPAHPTPAQALAYQTEQRRRLDSLDAAQGDDGAARLVESLNRRWALRAPSTLQDRVADLEDLVLLYDRIVSMSGLDGHADARVRLLATGPGALMPRLAAVRAETLDARTLALANGTDSPGSALHFSELQAKSDVLLSMLRAAVDRAVSTGLVDGEKMRADVRQLERHDEALRQLRDAVVGAPADAVASRGAPAAAEAQVLQLDLLARQSGRALVDACDRAIGQRLAELHRQLVDSMLREALCVLVLSLLALYCFFCNYMVVSGGIRQLCRHVADLAAGNLAIRPVGHGRDEISVALNALGTSARQLSEIFGAVTQGVGAVAHAAREVATGNRGLSGSTGDIRAAMLGATERANDFASLMHACGNEVESTVTQVRSMRGDARRSRNVMSGLRNRMRVLNTKSREINEVVKLMEAVAFQTKLLALNASVEAARAGVDGKGFSVVAQEVRALALRSEESAQRIHTIVASSMVEIEECNRMTEEASAAVTATDERIEAVHRSMNDIVAHTQAGMNGSREIANITRQADASIGGNVRIVDQLSAASAGLRDQGDALRRSVQHFLVV